MNVRDPLARVAPETAATEPDSGKLLAHIARTWDSDIVPQLIDYVRLPAKSPAFDPDWERNGHIEAAIRQAEAWVRAQPVAGMQVEIVRLAGRTPTLFFDIPATGGLDQGKTTVLYGHLDKQPEMVGWRADSGPWTPLYEGGRLYGRGAADDGYAVFAALAAIMALDAQGVPRPRCVGLIETCEESGSNDLPAYLDALAPRIGDTRLVIALDSGAGNYEQLWVTTSLRGMVGGTLTVEVLTEGVHSGDASGVVPSSFRIARQLLDRLDDSRTGRMLADEFHCEIPPERVDQAKQAAAILGDMVWKRFPWANCCSGPDDFTLPTTTDPVEAILNRTWRPALSVVGADGLPSMLQAGNVLRPSTSLKLSLRLPPLVDGPRAAQFMQELLQADPPNQARVTFTAGSGVATGWNAPAIAPWLASALDDSSMAFFQRGAAHLGEGGTIPFMGMLSGKMPNAQMLVTGVLGPKSNAHGPNEFLDVPYAKKVTAAVAGVIARAARA